MLRSTEALDLSASSIMNGNRISLGDGPIQANDVFVIGLGNPDAEVCLTLTKAFQPQTQANLPSTLDAGVSVQATLEPIAFALFAAVAISLATLSSTSIIDENEVWTTNYENPSKGIHGSTQSAG